MARNIKKAMDELIEGNSILKKFNWQIGHTPQESGAANLK